MEHNSSLRRRSPVRWLTVTALLMAVNIALSSFGMPVPGGHLYLNDVVSAPPGPARPPGGLQWAGSGHSWATFSSTPHRCSYPW